MQEKDIVLAPIPQRDGEVKLRPLLILKKLPTFDDFLVCGISTQVHQEIAGFDAVLVANTQNRLREDSLIRLSFLAVFSASQIKGRLGYIDTDLHTLLLTRLSHYLISP